MRNKWPFRPPLISGFCSVKQIHIGVFPSPLDGVLVHTGLPPAINSAVPIYTPGWGEALCE